jgi:hypothetical protein
MPLCTGLYYSVGWWYSAIVVGASVKLRRPADRATLHFFWLTVVFFSARCLHAERPLQPAGLLLRLPT